MPLQIVRDNITRMRCDAIVNPTDELFSHTGGVDAEVHLAAGEALYTACLEKGSLSVGEACLTEGFLLPCRYVIHTVGPCWRGGAHGEAEALRACYRAVLRLAAEAGCHTVALPLISSGTFGFPKDQVLRLAVDTVTEVLLTCELTVYLCVFDKTSYTFSRRLFSDIRSFLGVDDEPPAFAWQDRPMRSFCRSEPKPLSPRREKQTRMSPAVCVSEEACAASDAMEDDLSSFVRRMDKSFSQLLFDLIDERGMTDVECYKRANVDKRTFSKLKSHKDYRPSKPTAIAFAISLRLDLDTTQRLLATAGYTLSNSHVFDRIIRYFIHHKNYNVFEINEALFEFDQMLLGV